MKIIDLLWILAYPVYQILGTLRHEASHAIAAILEGAKVTEFVFWPTEGYWGYVVWEGQITALTNGAPYLCDLLTFGLAFWVCMMVDFKRRWVWLNIAILGILSPLINSFHNYRIGLRKPNDVGILLDKLSPTLVHSYFWVTMALYLIGLILVFRWSRTAKAVWEKEAKDDNLQQF